MTSKDILSHFRFEDVGSRIEDLETPVPVIDIGIVDPQPDALAGALRHRRHRQSPAHQDAQAGASGQGAAGAGCGRHHRAKARRGRGHGSGRHRRHAADLQRGGRPQARAARATGAAHQHLGGDRQRRRRRRARPRRRNGRTQNRRAGRMRHRCQPQRRANAGGCGGAGTAGRRDPRPRLWRTDDLSQAGMRNECSTFLAEARDLAARAGLETRTIVDRRLARYVERRGPGGGSSSIASAPTSISTDRWPNAAPAASTTARFPCWRRWSAGRPRSAP